MKGYYVVYQNEVRGMQLLFRDRNDDPWNPTYASVTVVNPAGDTIITDRECMVEGNTATMLITTEITSVAGSYNVLWKLTQEVAGINRIAYCKVIVDVEEL